MIAYHWVEFVARCVHIMCKIRGPVVRQSPLLLLEVKLPFDPVGLLVCLNSSVTSHAPIGHSFFFWLIYEQVVPLLD